MGIEEGIIVSSKLLVIIGTSDREKALSGLMYSRNTLRYKWFDKVRVVFFGPSERLAAHDEEVSNRAKEIAAITDCFACKAISDAANVSENLAEIGMKVIYVGDVISDSIKEGYVPIVW